MELEFGLKLKTVADEFTSNFQIAKDGGGVFMSTETDTTFILTANLKGYKRRNIKIEINEDGSMIGISGERQVKEETKRFKKTYRIPDGVILDEITAKFNDQESTLTIKMPKKVTGVGGAAIEEVKDKPEIVDNLLVGDEERLKEEKKVERPFSVDDLRYGDGRHIRSKEDEEKQGDIQEISEGVDGDGLKQDDDETRGEDAEEKKKGFRLCIPMVAGSTLLLTFVAYVIQIIRSKHQNSRNKD